MDVVYAGKLDDPDVLGRVWHVYVFFGNKPGSVDFVHLTWGMSACAREFRWNEASDELERQTELLILDQLDTVEYSGIFATYREKTFSLIEEEE